MACFRFQGLVPVIDPTSFVHPSASLIGDVIVGAGCYIGAGASLRGDFGRIVVEADANVQDNCTLHTGSGTDCIVGRGANIGHGAVLHGCRIGENALVGINAVVLDGAEIGAESLVAALSLVKSGEDIALRSFVAGNPARVIRTLAADEVSWRNDGDGDYQRLAREALSSFEPCDPLPSMPADRKRVKSSARAVRLGKAADRQNAPIKG